MNNLEELSRKYFEVWNSHNSKNVGDLFSENGSLRDWELLAEGRENVVNANQNIFNNVPKIKCEIINVHVSTNTNTVCAEIFVHLNNESGEKLKVVDVIEYDEDSLIKSLRAYKG